MKMGLRKPSVKKSIKARTTGKLKRTVKKTVDPTYGKKGVGYIKDPKRAVKNAVYNRTTVGVSDIMKGTDSMKKTASASASDSLSSTATQDANQANVKVEKEDPTKDFTIKDWGICLIVSVILFIIGLCVPAIHSLIRLGFIIFGFVGALMSVWEIIKLLVHPKDK